VIPVEIDVKQIIEELNAWGWKDQKIEVVCDFSPGYIAKLRGGPRPNRPYQLLARLYNFWVGESEINSVAETVQPT
jgi:hypothetical protein